MSSADFKLETSQRIDLLRMIERERRKREKGVSIVDQVKTQIIGYNKLRKCPREFWVL